ncbi:MAG TPA: hypothetical protein VHE61_08595 [Opitutaceae bacterium]|nr:hypothetical protein [Opitutaceae bacterium]
MAISPTSSHAVGLHAASSAAPPHAPKIGVFPSGALSEQTATLFKNAESAIDRGEQLQEEYGSITVSAPFLVPASGPSNPFVFDEQKHADDYFGDALKGIQGGLAQDNDSQFTLLAGAVGQANLDVIQAQKLAVSQATDQNASYQRHIEDLKKAAAAKRTAAIDDVPADASPQERQSAIDHANQTYYQDLAAVENTSPAPYPTQSSSGLPPAPDSSLLPTAKTDVLSTPGSVKTNSGSNVISDRSALITAAGDKATQGIFAVLGDPATYAAFADKKVLFGVGMVTVDPGWRTRTNFIGEVSVKISYTYQPARVEVIHHVYIGTAKYDPVHALIQQVRPALAALWDIDALSQVADGLPEVIQAKGILESAGTTPIQDQASEAARHIRAAAAAATGGDKEILLGVADRLKHPPSLPIPSDLTRSGRIDRNISPLVAAVSPMTDVQAIDFDSSIQQRMQLALSLAGAFSQAGMQAQAAFFTSYAKQLQSDLSLRTAQASITSFSDSGSTFGFRIGPRLSADYAPGGKQSDSQATSKIERTTFPVLIMVGLDTDDLGIVFGGVTGQIEIDEPVLQLSESIRWLPVVSPLARIHWTYIQRRLSEKRLAQSVNALWNVEANLDKFYQNDDPEAVPPHSRPTSTQMTALTLRDRAIRIIQFLAGSTDNQSIPIDYIANTPPTAPDPIPEVDQIIPDTISSSRDSDVQIALVGKHLNSTWRVTLLNGPSNAANSVTSAGDGALVVTIPKAASLNAGATSFRLDKAAVGGKPEVVILSPPLTITKPASPEKPAPTPSPLTLTHVTETSGNKTTDTYEGPNDQVAALEALVQSTKSKRGK